MDPDMGGALFTPSEGPHVTKPLRHLHEVAPIWPSTCAVLYFYTIDYIIILIYYNLWIIYIIHSIISINL